MDKRIVVLGANGFIGGWLVKRFRDEQQYPVLAITSQDCDFLSARETLVTLKDLNTRDIVIIAAAITRLRDNTFNGMFKNIQMTENIIQAVTGKGVCQIVYLSSVDVYGCLERKFKHRGKIHEAFELKPDDYYGVGKVACESLLRNQIQDQDRALSVLRLPGVFGPGDQMKSLVGQFLQQISQEGRLTIFGQGKDLREYLYIDDVYLAVKESIERRLNDTINVTSGKSYSIRQMVDIIFEVLNNSCQLEFREIADPANERIKNMEFDNTKLRKLLPGFKRHHFKESISEYVEHLKSQRVITETVPVR